LVDDVTNKPHICAKQVVIVSELFVYVGRPALVPIPYNLVYCPLPCAVIPINTCEMAVSLGVFGESEKYLPVKCS
jgi:hypothetical protein